MYRLASAEFKQLTHGPDVVCKIGGLKQQAFECTTMESRHPSIEQATKRHETSSTIPP